MRAFLYYFTHAFAGSIKKLFRNKLIAIILAFIVGFALIGGVVGVALGTVFSSVSEEQAGEVAPAEETIEDADIEMTEEEHEELFGVIEAVVGAVLLAVILIFVYTGDKSGVKIFNMADVNFLFASPMRPQSVLLFRTIMQMGVAFASSIYLLFQIPNWMHNMGLSILQGLCLFLGWIIALFIGKMVSVFVYTVTATYPKVRKLVKPLVLTAGAAPVLVLIALIRFGKKGILDSIVTVFAAKGTRAVPLFGWFRGFIMSMLSGGYLPAAGYFAALILFCLGFAWLIWRIKADFYEDALQGADELQKKLEERQKGVKTRKKERSAKISRNAEMSGEGAKVFFTKIVYNRRRFAKFMLITPTSVTYAGIAALIAAFLRFALNTQMVLPAGVVFCFVIFFRNLGNPLAEEVNHPFFFLAPESPFSKVRYAAAGGLYECLLDLLPGFLILQVMLPGEMQQLYLWLVLWLSLELFCSMTGLFTELALPSSIVPAIKQMLSISIRMVAILPGIFLLLLGITIGVPAAMACVIALNLALSAGLYAIAPRFLHAGKN